MIRKLNRVLSSKQLSVDRLPSQKPRYFLCCSPSTSYSIVRLTSNKPFADISKIDFNTGGQNWNPPIVKEVPLPESTKIFYDNGQEYVKVYRKLVEMEMEFHKKQLEEYRKTVPMVEWSVNGNSKSASFDWPKFPAAMISHEVEIGNYVILTPEIYVGHKTIKGYKGKIVQLPYKNSDRFVVELEKDLPSKAERDMAFVIELEFVGTPFERMLETLKVFEKEKSRTKSLLPDLYNVLLGKVKSTENPFHKVPLPNDFHVPGLPQLNDSQRNAIKNALSRTLTLIQGPPGTGKTSTAATLVYHLVKGTEGGRALVCSPSNIAVDNLAQQLEKAGLNVVRMSARSRDLENCTVSHLDLKAILEIQYPGLSQSPKKIFYEVMRKEGTKILANADVICCTSSMAGSELIDLFQPISTKKFQLVLVDESTQGTEPETLIPIMKGAQRVVLIGDHKQLGPTLMCKEAVDLGLQESLFERLIKAGNEYFALESQYRMHPAISSFPRKSFYEGRLKDGITADHRPWLNVDWQFPTPNPLMFWNCAGVEEQSFDLVGTLINSGVHHHQIGIITPYESQREYIVSKLYERRILSSFSRSFEGRLEIANVDAFQGREKDVIIISTVRSNLFGAIGFLIDERRLNVALTRARYGMVLIGNAHTLRRNFIWRSLLEWYESQRCLVEGSLKNLKAVKKDKQKVEKSPNFYCR